MLFASETHCALCNFPSKIQPDRAAAIVFLDMDGVLISRGGRKVEDLADATLQQLFGRKDFIGGYTELQWRVAYGRHLFSSNVDNLNLLLETIEKQRPVYLVLCSAWRADGTLKEITEEMFQTQLFSKYFVGKTPCQDQEHYCPEVKNGIRFEALAKEKYGLSLRSRAEQVEFWLEEHGLRNNDFVILDDYDDGFSEKFPKEYIERINFLNENDIKKALDIFHLDSSNVSLKIAQSIADLIVRQDKSHLEYILRYYEKTQFTNAWNFNFLQLAEFTGNQEIYETVLKSYRELLEQDKKFRIPTFGESLCWFIPKVLTVESCENYRLYQSIDISVPKTMSSLSQFQKYILHHSRAYISLDDTCRSRYIKLASFSKSLMDNPPFRLEEFHFTLCRPDWGHGGL